MSHHEKDYQKKTGLFIDDERIINMTEEIMADKKLSFQSWICDCGFIQCRPGDWLSVRKSGNFIFLMPAYELLAEKKNLFEFGPPYWVNKKGIFWTTTEKFKRIKQKVPDLAKQKSIRRLKPFEAAAMLIQEMPSELIQSCNACASENKRSGDCIKRKICVLNNGIKINTAAIEKVSGMHIRDATDIIENHLYALRQGALFRLEPITEKDIRIPFTLKKEAMTVWQGLYKTKYGFGPLIGETFKLKLK